MLRRSLALLGLCALAGCQDYNFNPVGKCIIQPGSSRISLGNVATADILFVVDDSGSMSAEQASLARNFSAFIDALATAQAERLANGLDPFEFHIAVTTSSVFEAWQPTSPPACTGSPSTCTVPEIQTHYQTLPQQAVACSDPGTACNEVIQKYWFQDSNPSNTFTYCANAGAGAPGAAYPAGDFVSVNGNPRVLHFTKDLKWSTWGSATPDPALTQLVGQFQQNISVGTCGSGMEQHFEAGRLALKKALGQDGLKQPTGIDPKEWPHAGAKLVVVWVGDEDDCSNPNDATRSLAFTNATSTPGADVCTADAAKPLDQQKEFKVSEYADFFTSLSRPFGAAFVYSANPSTCADDGNGNVVCDAGTCACQCPPSCSSCSSTAQGICNIPSDCSGKATGSNTLSRYHLLSANLRGKGVSTFEASVCDWNFSKTLQGIADLVKPIPGLTLPTQPATSQVAVLRIESSDGKTTRYCTGPGPGLDWDFVDCKTGAASTVVTSCILINHATRHCEANVGETYVAQYLGQVPQGGCATAADCKTALGGQESDWQCFGSTPGGRGTCVCNANVQ